MSPIIRAMESCLTRNNNATDSLPKFTINLPESPKQCSSLSDNDNCEWTGGDGDGDADSGISASDRNVVDGVVKGPLEIHRNTWLRSSLRRFSTSDRENLPNRRWGSFRQSTKRHHHLGSNALASQLYRSSSFNNSPARSSDTVDDLYSDVSLEDDVNELRNKFRGLEEQVGYLKDCTNQNDERYTRAKSDNAALQARVIMLEEQLRDTEIRYEERLQDEQKHYKELLLRLEREKQLQLENITIRLHAKEIESNNLKDEVTRQKTKIDKLENERKDLMEQIQNFRNDLTANKENTNTLNEHNKRLKQEHEAQLQLMDELSRELENLRSEARTPALSTTNLDTLRLEELHEEMQLLRNKNVLLEEANDELQANLLHARIEQGRMLTAGENNLAAELEAMSQDEPFIFHDHNTLIKMQQALKEQQEVNVQLRCYIDEILLNIVENYPQLLEVKQRSS